MTNLLGITVEIDAALDMGYIHLSDEPVASTVELTEDVVVELDDTGSVIGIEMLALSADIPYDKLTLECHVGSEAIDVLQSIGPSVQAFIASAQKAS